MTDDIQALWGEFEDVITSAMRPKFQGRRVSAVGVITAIDGYDDAGHPISATLSVGNSTTEKILRPPDHAAAGDSVVVDGDADPVNRNWTIVRFLTNAAIITASSPSRALPTVVPRAALTRVDQVSYGGYRSWAQLRYDVIRRGQLDLARQGIPAIAVRYRISGAVEWTQLAPVRHRPEPKQTTTLASDCSATDTTIHLVANDFFPTSANDSDPNEQIRVMLGDEIVSGYYHADGTLTGCTRGVEAVGTLGAAAAHLANATAVTLLIADAFVTGLTPGISYEAQVAPVDVNGTVGTYVPVAMLNFTAADLAANPANVDSDWANVEIIADNYEIRWKRVLLDANGDAMRAADALYQVRRLDKASPPSSDPANIDWVFADRLLGTTTGEEELLTNPYLLWPANRGTGGWFGIRTVRRSTPNLLYGDTIVWKKDDNPPPRPLLANVSVIPLTEGYQVTVAPSDPTFSDRGFLDLLYYEASSATGTGATLIATTPANTVSRYAPPGTTRYIQVVARDRAGNANALDVAYWQPVTPGFPDPPYPVNGRFELPNDAGTLPRYWTIATENDLLVTWEATGGVNGAKCLKFRLPAGTYASAPIAYLETTLPFPTNIGANQSLKFWVKMNTASAIGIQYRQTATYYDGSGSSVGTYSVDWLGLDESLTWWQPNTTLLVASGADQTIAAVSVKVRIRIPAGTYASDLIVWVDDMTWGPT